MARRYPAFKTPETIQIKLNRARRHIAELKTEVNSVFHTDCCSFAFEPDPQSSHYVLRVDGLPPIPDVWSAIVGDALHNMRSALDHLAGVLVKANKLDPGVGSRFPIRDRPFTDNGGRQCLADIPPGIGSDARLILTNVQPYTRWQHPDVVPAAQARRHPLYVLNDLDIRDKHRTLLIVSVAFNVLDMWWGSDSADSGPDIKRANFGPLKNGDPVAWFDFRGEDPDPDFDPHPSVQVGLNEKPVDITRQHSVVEFLEFLEFVVNGVMWEFAQFF